MPRKATKVDQHDGLILDPRCGSDSIDQRYNGWTNYETWNVVLWSTNDEGDYRWIRAERPYTAAKALRIAIEVYPDGTPDMVSAEAYDSVDWNEVASAWNELD